MRSRIAVAVLASLVAGGLAHGQPAAAPIVPAPPAPAAAPAVALDVGAAVHPDSAVLHEGCGSCGDCDCPQVCGPSGRIWAEVDYLWWWMKGSPLPPLITTSPPGTPVGTAGVLGNNNNTTILFGNHPTNADVRNGGRFTAGVWLDDCQDLGVEASFLRIEDRATNFAAGSRSGAQILSRPIINTTTFKPDAVLVSFPGVIGGQVSATSATDGLVGAGVLFRENLWCGCNYRLDVLGGYRFLQFADRLGITENLVNLTAGSVANVPAGTTAQVQDRFDCTNDFHGFDFGLTGEYREGPWRIRGLVKLAVGENFEIVERNGATNASLPGGRSVNNIGGVFNLLSNVGRLTRDRSIIVPELGLEAGVQLTKHVRGWIGYSGLYWSEAVWAGKQIDRTINQQLLPPTNGRITGPVRPTPLFGATSLWAQGVDVGLEVRY